MRKAAFYPKLALENIRRNHRFYLPFMLTCTICVSMFYIMCFITLNEGLTLMVGADFLYTIMVFGCIVIGLFSTIFLFYTNSFLMKRRQKELGLYNVLGMGKGNIAAVMLIETLFVAVVTIILGFILGILFSKLTLLLLCRLLKFSVPFGFEISFPSMLICLSLFSGIFLLILLSNLVRIKLSSPIELLHGGNVGEKEPKTRWFLAFLGILNLGGGYYIAIVTESPLQALLLFFVAVILVIIGTYLIFTASSIAILKKLKSRPRYYYKTSHFIPVSGMIYRMKQNAVGLGNICILSTMVLVMVSGTVCLYLGAEDNINFRYPKEISVNITNPMGDTRENLESMVPALVREEGYEILDILSYESFELFTTLNENDFGNPDTMYFSNDTGCIVSFVPERDYRAMTASPVCLSSEQALVYSKNKTLKDSFKIYGNEYDIVGFADDFIPSGQVSFDIGDVFFFIVAEDTYNDIYSMQSGRAKNLFYGFDADASAEESPELFEKVSNLVYSFSSSSPRDGFDMLMTESRQENAKEFYALYGGFLFLGLFLGLVFLIAAVLIIYYKQLSEGYDDRERFEIMQKVGLSQDEIKKAIHSQILLVFFLPLIMAVLHIAFAFKMITKLLMVMGLTNLSLFALCVLGTITVFAAIYGLVYSLTAKSYYRIVSR